MKKLFYWLPRVLAVLFILFISISALDVFGQPKWFLALFIHLIPSFILIILTVVAWRHEWAGGLLFVLAGLLLIITSFFESAIVSAPVIITGLLFLFSSHLY